MGDLFVDLLQGGVVTLQIATGAWVLGAMLGLALSISVDLGHGLTRVAVTAVSTILRSVPVLVILYVLYFGLGYVGLNLSSLLAAILGLGIAESAFLAEYYRAGIMTVPHAQRDAGASLGLSRFGVLRHVVIPQTVRFMTPPLLNSFAGLLKTATIASAIGAPEILYRGQADMQRVGHLLAISALVIIIYVVFTVPLTRFVGVLESRVQIAT